MNQRARDLDGLTPRAVVLCSCACLAALLLASPAAAEPEAAYPVSGFSVSAPGADTGTLGIAGLLDRSLRFAEVDGVLVPPTEDDAGTPLQLSQRWTRPRRFSGAALGAVVQALLAALQAEGHMGLGVGPHPDDIDVATGRDLRPPERSALRLVVSAGRLRELRTVAYGSRIGETWRIDNRAHRRIRKLSPLQPREAGLEGTSDILNKEVLERYLFRLNRHPGRNVAAALTPSTGGDGVALDYRVSEAKAWYAYAQGSNTGTNTTQRWQTRAGLVHRQLLDRDDVFRAEYLTAAAFESLHSVSASYELPWFGPRRPDWYKSDIDDPWYLRWLHRDKLPWFGTDRLRLRAFGGYFTSEARALDGLASGGDIDQEEWHVGGELIANLFQHRALFVDLAGGFRARNIASNNLDIDSTDQETRFLIPSASLRAERLNQVSTLLTRVDFEANVGDTESSRLGRAGADDGWKLLRWSAGVSHYLEPLLRPGAWRDPSTPGSSTLAHEVSLGVRGQYAFGSILPPQFSQVLGGLYSVRGYKQSAAVGDDVVVGSFEYRFHLPAALGLRRDPLRLPYVGDFRLTPQQVYGRADWDLIFRAFVDGGLAWRNCEGSACVVQRDNELLSAGLGLELQLRSWVRARADWATALSSVNADESGEVDAGDHEFHFLFSVLY